MANLTPYDKSLGGVDGLGGGRYWDPVSGRWISDPSQTGGGPVRLGGSSLASLSGGGGAPGYSRPILAYERLYGVPYGGGGANTNLAALTSLQPVQPAPAAVSRAAPQQPGPVIRYGSRPVAQREEGGGPESQDLTVNPASGAGGGGFDFFGAGGPGGPGDALGVPGRFESSFINDIGRVPGAERADYARNATRDLGWRDLVGDIGEGVIGTLTGGLVSPEFTGRDVVSLASLTGANPARRTGVDINPLGAALGAVGTATGTPVGALSSFMPTYHIGDALPGFGGAGPSAAQPSPGPATVEQARATADPWAGFTFSDSGYRDPTGGYNEGRPAGYDPQAAADLAFNEAMGRISGGDGGDGGFNEGFADPGGAGRSENVPW